MDINALKLFSPVMYWHAARTNHEAPMFPVYCYGAKLEI
jgi:hypothetical protein